MERICTPIQSNHCMLKRSGSDCCGFYHPQQVDKPAVILMAHGLAALRHFKLVQYAQRFASAGYAVVLFDYRYWGGVQDVHVNWYLLVLSLKTGGL